MKPPWVTELEKDEEDPQIESLISIILVLIVVLFCFLSVAMIYQIAHSPIDHLLTILYEVWK